MTPIIENGLLDSDLDLNGFSLVNLGGIDPVPTGIVLSTDPRLSDARLPLDGSVTDASVAVGAAIAQSKLNFSGFIPPAWLGTTSVTAAEGDLAEYLSNKGIANGYAGLDGSGKVPSAQLPATTGTGTVTSVGMSVPTYFSISGTPITGAGLFAVSWNAAAIPALSWFGNATGSPAAPVFNTTPIPTALIPSLDASQVTSGVFAAALLPPAVGLGGSHASGAVPDPGDGTGGALATDYLARDMSYKHAPTIAVPYQPTIPNPTFSTSANLTGPVLVVPQSTLSDVIFFYSTVSGATGFQEFPSGGVSVAPAATIWVYAAQAGYNNSAVVSYTNPNP